MIDDEEDDDRGDGDERQQRQRRSLHDDDAHAVEDEPGDQDEDDQEQGRSGARSHRLSDGAFIAAAIMSMRSARLTMPTSRSPSPTGTGFPRRCTLNSANCF